MSKKSPSAPKAKKPQAKRKTRQDLLCDIARLESNQQVAIKANEELQAEKQGLQVRLDTVREEHDNMRAERNKYRELYKLQQRVAVSYAVELTSRETIEDTRTERAGLEETIRRCKDEPLTSFRQSGPDVQTEYVGQPVARVKQP